MDEPTSTPGEEPAERVDDLFVLRTMFASAEADQYETNRAAARRAEQLADILEFAASNPDLYVERPMKAGAAGSPEEWAQRCAA
ncbi:hypothetical protein, partial [Microbacterium sp. KR10-403]|uniref:hypothetical protein n=1 Tax=Microbacterium sp. KR10-403 TaxID=3158581 RepID=UPI0032E40AD2